MICALLALSLIAGIPPFLYAAAGLQLPRNDPLLRSRLLFFASPAI